MTAQEPPDDRTLLDQEERKLLDRLRGGDQQAFAELVERYHPAMVRLAMAFVGSRAAAEDVAQEAWLGVLRGLPAFEGRSSLRTWLFRILTNRAKTRGAREGRLVPFADLAQGEDLESEPAEPLDRFFAAGEPSAGHWSSSVPSWEAMPEERLLSHEVRDMIRAAIAELPPNQRAVITLRDIEGYPPQEICNILEISESNQRVLLHRARARVRRALEAYLTPEEA
jgi:RNA polymerase sigma-70 factor (ECF subfamily)